MELMLDLETLGVRPGAAIRSIGAVTFTLADSAAGGETFYANIDTYSCLYAGLQIEQGTHEWWKGQSQEARDSLQVDQQPLVKVAAEFYEWGRARGITKVWAQGANFDPGLWEAAARAVNIFMPWKFYNVRDTRTLYDLAGWNPKQLKREGTYHNALDDARHQVACCREAYRRLKCPVTPVVNTNP